MAKHEKSQKQKLLADIKEAVYTIALDVIAGLILEIILKYLGI